MKRWKGRGRGGGGRRWWSERENSGGEGGGRLRQQGLAQACPLQVSRASKNKSTASEITKNLAVIVIAKSLFSRVYVTCQDKITQ